MSFFEKAIEVLHGPEDWIDAAIISNVISEIGHRRSIHWRDPNSIDPEFHQIIESLDDAIQVSYAVSVAVLKRTRINLCISPRIATKRDCASKFAPGRTSN